MKTACQAGWSLTHTKSSSGFQFVTVRSIDSSNLYAEFWFPEPGDGDSIEASVKNDVGFFDLPLSVVQLIRYWFGCITFEEYDRALKNL